MNVWLLAARPKTLGAGVAPVLMGLALAVGDRTVHFPSFVCALLGSLFIQIGTNFANDYFDHMKGADTPNRIGPLRVTQAGLISPHLMWRATIVVFGVACLPGLYLVWRGGWPIIAIGLASIVCGILYTGGPLPFGYYGLGDFFVLVFFGPVAVAGTYYVQALTVTSTSVIAGIASGLFSVAILVVNNLRDIDQDRVAGKRTLAVRFGRSFARWEYAIALVTGSIVIPVILAVQTGRWGVVVSALTLLVAIRILRTVFTSEEGETLNHALALTGKLLLLFSVLFFVGWLL